MKSLTTLQAPDLSIPGGGGNQLLKWIVDKFYPVGSCFIVGGATNPNNEFKGNGWSTTWKELPEGTFLRATGTNGSTSSGISTDGGSNTHNHIVGAQDDTSAYAIMDTNFANADGATQRGILTRTSHIKGYSSDLLMFIDGGAASFRTQTDALTRLVQVVGSTKSASNEPLYKNCHIWLRTK